ncbi:MAG: hypothetical protein IT499_21450 [Rubrivivax sp.]|nr:hypothetical protein [Rubrivivax sp.]MCL4696259.1 hypothetical protein [Burkholderiaceae bacterium]
MRFVLLLLVALTAASAAGQQATVPPTRPASAPTPAPECTRALQALAAAEDAAIASRAHPGTGPAAASAPPPTTVLERRRAAARACLRGSDERPAPGARIPPPRADSAGRAGGARPMPPALSPVTPSAAPPSPPAPSRPPPPVVVTACDPTGCWASDGTRLHRHGVYLLGPRGLCSAQGPFLACP